MPPSLQYLLTDAQLGDEGAVTVDVLLHQVVEHAAALADHLEQATAGVVVLRMLLQVLGELADAGGQDRNLDLRRTGVGRMGAIGLDNCGLVFLADHGSFTS